MTRGTLVSILIIFANTFFVPNTYAQIINEICPVSSDQRDYEWVEIYNNTDNAISASQYNITDSTNKSLIWQASEIPPGGYLLATSSSVLNNSGGDSVVLKDSTGNTISSQSYTGSFGANSSYVRCSDGTSWLSSNLPSPLSDNNGSCQVPTPPTTTQSNTETDYTSIYVSEVMVDPATDQNEWVELYNHNSFTVNLNNWQIDDTKDQGASPYTFSLTIPSYSYATFEITKNMFNNDGDTVRLVNYQNVEKESFGYSTSEKEKSIGKINVLGNAVCIQNPSKNGINSSCINNTNNQTATTTQPSRPAISTSQTIPISQIISKKDEAIASEGQHLASQESSFSLPDLLGSIKGVTTTKKNITKKTTQPNPKELKTASSYAMTSFMFAWANICYILFKIRKKMKSSYENPIA